MPFLLTSKCSHIKDVTGSPEDIKKTMMASKTTEDGMVLKINYGRTTSYMLKDIGSREWLKNM